ncbi:hypothetical protein [Luteimonas sp. R10]|uniref:hypothetical protein n=1 Tax=Luteimonas sp. R10 TaxID=3108176 RepID=UPI00308C4F63|nr:hypothetical protein U3649_02335 [Luteimonas sp. R10]
MAVQLISYDLRKPGRNYDDVYEAIKKIGTWWHCLESVWLVKTNSSSGDIRNHLKQFIDKNDDLVVFGLNGNWATYGLSDDCNNWLRNNLAA